MNDYQCSFHVGSIVRNADIVTEFRCGNMGGLRRSTATNSLVIISDHTKSFYEDKWHNKTLYYTGMGKKGDQYINFMQNKTLANSEINGVTLHLFEVLKPTEYTYRGIVSLSEHPYQEQQYDKDGINRKVWIFPLTLINEQAVSEDSINAYIDEQAIRARSMNLSELRLRASQNNSEVVSSRKVVTQIFIRDPYIAEYAKRRANGKCQLCKCSAPFKTTQGDPYLECHHIDWVSKGGSDTIDNTVALCPNCHRKMHVLSLESDIQTLRNEASLE